MSMGTLKETLVFMQDNGVGSHRYEIYKSDSKGGYFAVIYIQKHIISDGSTFVTWIIDNSCYCLRSHYIPNARIECESHWKENYRALNVL
ncbi:hypothetical protein B4923_04715 [Brenneria roseae subsp. americana]|uniref:Uncharacterized protein n=1 Tax=Brenneria roseae subsp. americana TaxID=1508507 RepID=A0A2U1TXT7_9GAMM|nr:hypothetical protein B4923_04715 [Brenneria roseae subsp. americana]PWC22201.1 hypothetical protein DDT52_02800 [Brenneria roseae subsp. roseae]